MKCEMPSISKSDLIDSSLKLSNDLIHFPSAHRRLLAPQWVNADGSANKKDQSLAENTSQNLIIEGDNLEVLKLLQASYFEKVKCIYIDPPYNTGNDFIYDDDFAASVTDYGQRAGEMDAHGQRLVANTEANGRFHSDWLSMMYPRLKLARNLLRADGAHPQGRR